MITLMALFWRLVKQGLLALLSLISLLLSLRLIIFLTGVAVPCMPYDSDFIIIYFQVFKSENCRWGARGQTNSSSRFHWWGVIGNDTGNSNYIIMKDDNVWEESGPILTYICANFNKSDVLHDKLQYQSQHIKLKKGAIENVVKYPKSQSVLLVISKF